MKKSDILIIYIQSLVISFFMLLFLSGCTGKSQKNVGFVNEAGLIESPKPSATIIEGDGAVLSFETSRYDFGFLKIRKNPTVTIDFEFTNTGNEPLVILKVDVSCSCLSADYPKTAIQPGDKGNITVAVETEGQKGNFNKPIFVKSNALNDVELLRIKGVLK